MRLGSAKTVETMFLRLVVALAFRYICKRYGMRLGNVKVLLCFIHICATTHKS